MLISPVCGKTVPSGHHTAPHGHAAPHAATYATSHTANMSGDSARLRSMWDELDRQERELKIEQKHLSDIWLKVCEKHKKSNQQ